MMEGKPLSRNTIRIGLLFATSLLSPVAAAAHASVIPLEPAPPAEESKPVASPGCPSGSLHLDCILGTLSASASAD